METAVLERKVKQLPFEARQDVSDYLDFFFVQITVSGNNMKKNQKNKEACLQQAVRRNGGCNSAESVVRN